MGGNINITLGFLLGIQVQPAEPANGTNDIDAGSQFGLASQNVSFATPIVPKDSQKIINLIESEQTFSQACQKARTSDESSGLTVKGKGGIPPAPTEPFDSDTLLIEEQNITPNLQTQYPDIKPIKTSIGDIFPARGIIKTEDGKIILTRYPTHKINTRTPHKSANCTPS